MSDVELIPGLAVSRETVETLTAIQAMVAKWNPAINLVSKSTLSMAWSRHILDSVQLFKGHSFSHWADLGSGGGFPGLVIATLAKEFTPVARVTLVEVDQRKATFLREAVRSFSLVADVKAERIEILEPLGADIVSARALAPLTVLCGYAQRHLAPSGVAILPKGAGWRDEVAEARKQWSFGLETSPSSTDPASVVLTVKEIQHV